MLKITHNNIALPLVTSTIKIKKVNNALVSSFSVSKTSRPMFLIENEQLEKALGVANLYTQNSNVFKGLTIIEGDQTFKGTLTIKEHQQGKRKADVAYTNVLLENLKNKIHTYFVPVDANGGTPAVYKKELSYDINDVFFKGFVQNHIPRNFPEVDFNFPSIKHPSKFGTDAKPEDEWYHYLGEINHKNIDVVSLNNEFTGNTNVITPFYYLLSPLYKVFKSNLGYTLTGSFLEDEINFKRLFYSKNNNLVKVKIGTKTIYKHHSTIHPERYLPNKSVAEYLNDLINCFNLKIDINNVTKTVTLNYCEQHYFKKQPLDISHFHFTENVYPIVNSTTNYLLKDATEQEIVNFSLSEISNKDVVDENTTVLKTAFKAAPNTITKDWDDSSGVGLLLYNYFSNDTYHLQEFDNKTNYLEGAKGIAANYWYKWLELRIRAKTLKPKVVLTNKQKNDIEKHETLYLKQQEFVLKSIEFELFEDKFLAELELISKHL